MQQHRQSACLGQLLRVDVDVDPLHAPLDGLLDHILQLVVGSQILLGPLGEDFAVDLALQATVNQATNRRFCDWEQDLRPLNETW